MTLRICAALVVALLALTACDADDGASVRDLGGSASSGSGSGSGSGTGTASGSGTETAECEPGDPTDPALTVALEEYAVLPEEDKLTPGPTRFRAVNAGNEVHELYVAAAKSIEGLPLDPKGSVDTEKLEEKGQLIGEVEGIPSGQSCDLEAELPVGTYVLFCNIRERGDKGVVNHFLQGMRTRVKVV
ncbi:MAG: hypothetical protein M3134_07845 [Actinomycetota bacterium]|nr:hypothetical protein [Actinomycetota bacterium]